MRVINIKKVGGDASERFKRTLAHPFSLGQDFLLTTVGRSRFQALRSPGTGVSLAPIASLIWHLSHSYLALQSDMSFLSSGYLSFSFI